MSHFVLAYYNLTQVENPEAEVKAHHAFCAQYDLKGRLYIAHQGINGQMSGTVEAAEAYMTWMKNHPLFHGTVFKIHNHHEHVFPRMTIKKKPQLVAIDKSIDLAKRAPHLPPQDWRKKLESGEAIVIDVRNDYEWDIGRFKGTDRPTCNTFREFEAYAEQLEKTVDPEKATVLMCCTGGIRCELFSPLLIEKGFKHVYQLEGGIINWGLVEGSDLFEGKLFVFDDRLQVPLSNDPAPVVGKCHHCQSQADQFYNCANMDCNQLFLSCPSCLEAHKGCCQESCHQAKRVRPYHHQSPHKPFRKWYHYAKTKEELITT